LRGESKYGVSFISGGETVVSSGEEQSLARGSGFSELGGARKLKRKGLPPNFIDVEYRLVEEPKSVNDIERQFIGVGKGYAIGGYKGIDTFKGVAARSRVHSGSTFRNYLGNGLGNGLVIIAAPKSEFEFRQGTSSGVIPMLAVGQHQGQESAQIQMQNLDTSQVQSQIVIQAQEQKQEQVIDTAQIVIPVIVSTTTNENPPIKPRDTFKFPPQPPPPSRPPERISPKPKPPREKPPEDIIETPNKKEGDSFFKKRLLMKKKFNKAYSVFIGGGKKARLVAEGLTRGEALAVGSREAMRTLAATFSIREGGTTERPNVDFIPNPQVFRGYQIKKGQRINTPNQFIQRQRQRLITGSERQLIKQSRQFGGMRRRRSKWF
jgi:hypothetical protein